MKKNKSKKKEIRLTKKTFIVDCLSTRALRAICLYFDVPTEQSSKLIIDDLSSIRYDRLLGIKNCGDTTTVEILDVYFQAKNDLTMSLSANSSDIGYSL